MTGVVGSVPVWFKVDYRLPYTTRSGVGDKEGSGCSLQSVPVKKNTLKSLESHSKLIFTSKEHKFEKLSTFSYSRVFLESLRSRRRPLHFTKRVLVGR